MAGFTGIVDGVDPDLTAEVTAARAIKVDGSAAGGGAVTLASGAVASGAYASGSIASGAIASGAVASGAVAAGALAAGAGVDGWDLTQGTKADAAVTNPASSGSVIALLKGWLTGRGAVADAAWTTGSGSVIALLKAIAGAAISTDPVQTYQSATYNHITAAAPTDTVVKSGAGTLVRIVVNKTTALGVITVYDNTSAAGTVIAIITQPAAVLESQVSLEYGLAFGTGLTITTATAAQDITVVYR